MGDKLTARVEWLPNGGSQLVLMVGTSEVARSRIFTDPKDHDRLIRSANIINAVDLPLAAPEKKG